MPDDKAQHDTMKFEIGLYNRHVRRLVERGQEENLPYHRSWADLRYLSYQAPTADQARALCSRDYPEREGFIIVSVDRVLERV